MAAVSALAEHPERVDKVMISNDTSSNGIYAMTMYPLGVPFTQIIDDWIPMNGDNTLFAGLGKDGSSWGAVVEKMFAKFYGNYEHIVGGWMYDAVSALNGSPYSSMFTDGNTTAALWTYIKTAETDKDIITAGSLGTCGGDSQSTPHGIACGHAYTILDAAEITRADGSNVKLLKMRNPWG